MVDVTTFWTWLIAFYCLLASFFSIIKIFFFTPFFHSIVCNFPVSAFMYFMWGLFITSFSIERNLSNELYFFSISFVLFGMFSAQKFELLWDKLTCNDRGQMEHYENYNVLFNVTLYMTLLTLVSYHHHQHQ